MTNFKDEDIVFVKLTCGDEIICALQHVNDSLLAHDPLQLVSHLTETGLSTQMFEYLPYTMRPLQLHGVAVMGYPTPDVLAAYKKKFSKIITPDSKIIV